MLRRLAIAMVLLATSAAGASSGLEVRTTCARDVVRDPVQLRTLRSELAQALATLPGTVGYTLDVSIVRVAHSSVRGEVEVRIELHGVLSDERGRMRWAASAQATARGRAKDRAWLQREAMSSAAQRIAKNVVVASKQVSAVAER